MTPFLTSGQASEQSARDVTTRFPGAHSASAWAFVATTGALLTLPRPALRPLTPCARAREKKRAICFEQVCLVPWIRKDGLPEPGLALLWLTAGPAVHAQAHRIEWVSGHL